MKKIILFLLLFSSSAFAQFWNNDTLTAGWWHGSPIDTPYLNMTQLHAAFDGGSGLAYIAESLNTASPNGTVNAVALTVTGGSTNANFILQPKGTGGFSTHLFDGTATGGNIIGAWAIDLQLKRSSATYVASGSRSVVLGGEDNLANASYCTIGGGYNNVAGSNTYATVAGGAVNTAGGQYAAVGGGDLNTANGTFSCIPGGKGLTLSNDGDFGFLAHNGNAMTIATNNVSVFGNTDMWLANNDNTPRGLCLFEAYNSSGTFPNTANFTKIVAGVQSADITYTLPTAAPVSDGYVLSSTTGGTLSWSVPLAGSITSTTYDLEAANVGSVVRDTDIADVLIAATSLPATAQWKFGIRAGDLPTGAIIQDYAFIMTFGGKNNNGASARTINWRFSVNNVDKGSAASGSVPTATPFWKASVYGGLATPVVVGDTIGLKLFGSVTNDLDFRYATIYFVPRFFTPGSGILQAASGVVALHRTTITGAVSGVTYLATALTTVVPSFYDQVITAILGSFTSGQVNTIGAAYRLSSTNTIADNNNYLGLGVTAAAQLNSLNGGTSSFIRYIYKYTVN